MPTSCQRSPTSTTASSAVLLYTSGTTSLPKGVMLTHGALTDYVMGRTEPADGEDHGRMLLAAPLYHIAGVTSLLGALYGGRTVVLLPAVRRRRVVGARRAPSGSRHAFLVPTMVARLVDHPELADADLSSLESVTYGAAPMPPAIIRRALERFPPSVGVQPGVRPDRDQLDGHRAHARRPPPRRIAGGGRPQGAPARLGRPGGRRRGAACRRPRRRACSAPARSARCSCARAVR